MALLNDVGSLVRLRKELHKFPELSGHEKKTSRRIYNFLSCMGPDEIIRNIGGEGVAARFLGKSPGLRVMVRAELDALPVYEINKFEHSSSVDGVSHACGHDGHMAIVAGVAERFAATRPERGEVVVLYQPSEENGRGASEVINDPLFASVKPDFILALHNLPGFVSKEIVLCEDVFAMASAGMIINLKGKTSHAAEPERGISPSAAVSEILRRLPLIAESDDFSQFTLATIIHARIGSVAFGTSPGEAVVMATLRAGDNKEMEDLTARAGKLVKEIAGKENLTAGISMTEKFPATVNDPFLTRIAAKIAGRQGLRVSHINEAFRWSEDFGWFTRKFRGLLFGIGAGSDHPDLHNPDYDFPDEIIETGTNLMTATCLELLNCK